VQPLSNSQHFMEPKDSLPNLQELSNFPYPEPDKSSPHLHSISIRSILILSTQLQLGLPSDLIPSGFPTSNTFNEEWCLLGCYAVWLL
jgi:hypothetical protein